MVSLRSQAKYNKPEERAKMGKYGTENGLAKAAGHFSQILDGKAEAVRLYVVVGYVNILVKGPNHQI